MSLFLADRVRQNTATTGTGTMTLGTATSAAFRTLAGVSAPDGARVPYLIEDGAAVEIGVGVYTVSGTTLSRGLRWSSTGSLLNLSGSATVAVYAGADEIGVLSAPRTTSFSAVAGVTYPVSTSGGAVTATLPASPAAGDRISFFDAAGAWGTNNLTIARNGNNIAGAALNLVCNVSHAKLTLAFVSGYGWVMA